MNVLSVSGTLFTFIGNKTKYRNDDILVAPHASSLVDNFSEMLSQFW
jgi:hypothetical protein